MLTRRFRSFALVVVGLIPAIWGDAALAQGGRRGFPDVTGPQIDSAEVEQYTAILGLDDEQLDAARQLQQAYVAELDKLGQKVREITDAARNEFRETRDPSVWRDLRNVVEKFSEQRDALTASTLSDLRLLLSPEQDAKWVEVEQFRRRRHDLVQGAMLSGEGVDLIAITQGETLPPESKSAVDQLLAQYAGELDRAIQERDRARKKQTDAENAEEAGGPEVTREDEQRFYDEIRDKSAAIRDLNRRYVRQIVSEVGGEESVQIEEVFQQASFPRVYSDSATEKAFQTVLAMTDLSEDRASEIKAAHAAYLRDRAAANRRLADAIEKQEMDRSAGPPRRGGPPGFGRGPGGPGGQGGNDETRQLFEARRDIDVAAMEKLRSMLTADQAKRLPEPPNDDWRTQDFEAS